MISRSPFHQNICNVYQCDIGILSSRDPQSTKITEECETREDLTEAGKRELTSNEEEKGARRKSRSRSSRRRVNNHRGCRCDGVAEDCRGFVG